MKKIISLCFLIFTISIQSQSGSVEYGVLLKKIDNKTSDENAKIIGKKIDEHQLEFFVESILYEKGLIDYKPTVPKEKPAKPSTTEANQ